MSVDKILRTMERVARAGGEMALSMQSEVVRQLATSKGAGGRDIATKGDTAAEHLMRTMLAKAYPAILFVGEEANVSRQMKSRVLKKSGWKFVVDPIDGTTNYKMGRPEFATTIAAIFEGRPAIGVIYLPATKTMISAVRFGGCFCNGEPLTLSSTLPPLHESVMAMEWVWWLAEQTANGKVTNDIWARQQLAVALKTRGNHQSLSAVYSLAQVLLGKEHGYVNLHRPADGACVWDFAAADIALEEATGEKGVIVLPNGSIPKYDQVSMQAICGPSPERNQEIVKLIQAVKA